MLFIALFICRISFCGVYKIGDAWGTVKNYTTLQELIDAGAGKGVDDEIWIAGNHELTSMWEISTWQGKIYGGFSGSETTVNQRQLKSGGRGWDFLYPTTLSLKTKSATQNSLIWSKNYKTNGEIPSLIDGICFDGTNCTATPLWFRQYSSSGISIRNCIFENSDLPTDNILDPGTADYIAGGIQLGSDDASKVGNTLIEECIVRNCKARVGAIVARNVTVRNCIIMDNTGSDADKSGGIFAYGTTNIDNSVLYGNQVANTVNNANIANAVSWTAANCIIDVYSSLFTEANNNIVETDRLVIFSPKLIMLEAPATVSVSALPACVSLGSIVSFRVEAAAGKIVNVTVNGNVITANAEKKYTIRVMENISIRVTLEDVGTYMPVKATTEEIDWENFLSIHDMYWTSLTADPIAPTPDNNLKTGYYAGALMGNGLLGTNMYKLTNNVYRLNTGRSDITEVRKPYDLYNSARLPIGYFTLSTVGNVTSEKMRLSLYNAMTKGSFTTDKGNINFKTYVHADQNYIVFETETKGDENDFVWDFVPQEAISPRHIQRKDAPAGYLNSAGKANPDVIISTDGDYHLSVQPLATDNTFATIGKVYVVAWKELKEGNKRRIIATISQEDTAESAIAAAKTVIDEAFGKTSNELETSHKAWWNNFYKNAAFLTFPTTKYESFYWSQYYKFASTTRPGKPIVDLQGVWPTWDTPWTSVWINLNLQLTYSWQSKANLGFLSEPLWESLNKYKDNLRRNVTDIPAQSNWTDAACLGRTSTYDFLAPLDPALASKNQYEVGNLTWLLFYYWQHCVAYGDKEQLKTKLFPMLKSAINLFSHIRTTHNGVYGLPSTASPEYVSASIGTNANYDLANLRWGLKTLIEIDTTYQINDPLLNHWKDFYANLIDYPYSSTTGYKVSDSREFATTTHRHYSHLFMIYPYHLVDWENPVDGPKMELSVNRWVGDQGYSRTGKAAMLASKGDGEGALSQMNTFMSTFLKPNTLYAETGPVIETPMSAVSTLHEFYMQDWGDKIRVFFGVPTSWIDASFVNMRAKGAFLISATRKTGKTVFIQVESEKGGLCRLQTGIHPANMLVRDLSGNDVVYAIADATNGVIEVQTHQGDIFQVYDKTQQVELPAPIAHPVEEGFSFGDGSHSVPLLGVQFKEKHIVLDNKRIFIPELAVSPTGAAIGSLIWSCHDNGILKNNNGLFSVLAEGETWVAFTTTDKMFTDTCYVRVTNLGTGEYIIFPVADSYVHDASASKDSNFGTEEHVVVKKDNSGYNRVGYYCFPISDIVALKDESSVVISLYVTSTDAAANTVDWLFYAAENDWTETGITWNNRPASSSMLLATVSGFNTTSGSYSPDNRLIFDITDYVAAKKAEGKDFISFSITQSARATNGGGKSQFASKENQDGLTLPMMIVKNADVTSVISLSKDKPNSPSSVSYFNLRGIKIVKPDKKGIYIIQENGKARKHLVK